MYACRTLRAGHAPSVGEEELAVVVGGVEVAIVAARLESEEEEVMALTLTRTGDRRRSVWRTTKLRSIHTFPIQFLTHAL